MKKTDILFKDITNDKESCSRDFCYIGWEGTGSFAFWKYAEAYFKSAEVLFDKFKTSTGNNFVLDSMGITMCFLYRHFVELTIKYLFVRYVCKTEQEYKTFLNIGHNLHDLWQSVKPKLKELKKRVGSSVNLGILEQYIMEFDRFDKDSMAMRYPIKKDLTKMTGEMRLDIFNLHSNMQDLYWSFVGIDGDIENQLEANVAQDKIDAFLFKYEDLRGRLDEFLNELEPYVEVSDEKIKTIDIIDYIITPKIIKDRENVMNVFRSCSDDELILFDTLYYTGRAIFSRELRLPKNPHEAKIDAVKMCIINMKRDHLEFGKPKNDQINIINKGPDSIVKFIKEVISVIDWNK